jgi:hypothetical protein
MCYLCYPSHGWIESWVFGRSSKVRRWKTACHTCCTNFAVIGASAFHPLTPNELRQRRLLLPTNLQTRYLRPKASPQSMKCGGSSKFANAWSIGLVKKFERTIKRPESAKGSREDPTAPPIYCSQRLNNGHLAIACHICVAPSSSSCTAATLFDHRPYCLLVARSAKLTQSPNIAGEQRRTSDRRTL